jgi:hypothetical protein
MLIKGVVMEAECELLLNEELQPMKDRLYRVETSINGNGTKGLRDRMDDMEVAVKEGFEELKNIISDRLKPRGKKEEAKYSFKKAISVVGITSGTALIMKLIDVFFL